MSEQFSGRLATIYSFSLTHRLLIIRTSDLNGTASDQFIKCWFCKSLPQQMEWTISCLLFHRISEHFVILLDEAAGITLMCTEITITDNPEMRGIGAVKQ